MIQGKDNDGFSPLDYVCCEAHRIQKALWNSDAYVSTTSMQELLDLGLIAKMLLDRGSEVERLRDELHERIGMNFAEYIRNRGVEEGLKAFLLKDVSMRMTDEYWYRKQKEFILTYHKSFFYDKNKHRYVRTV